jgi:hypothetical protein
MKPCEHLALLVWLLVKAPRTVAELAEHLQRQNQDTIYERVRAFHAEGLLYIKDWVRNTDAEAGRLTPLWAWQPDIDEPRPDAPKPPPKNLSRWKKQ